MAADSKHRPVRSEPGSAIAAMQWAIDEQPETFDTPDGGYDGDAQQGAGNVVEVAGVHLAEPLGHGDPRRLLVEPVVQVGRGVLPVADMPRQ
jgi:hypothetical protein